MLRTLGTAFLVLLVGMGERVAVLGDDVLQIPLESPGIISLSVSDLDGNGFPDVAALNWGEELVEVFLRGGPKIFEQSDRYEAVVGSSPQAIAAGDIDGDENLDLVTYGQYGSSVYSIFYGDGKGKFPSGGGLITDSLDGTSSVLTDIDGDGLLDRIVATAFGDTVIAFRFLSSTTGQQTLHSGVSGGEVVLAGDLDGNGQKDIVVWGTKLEPNLAVFLGSAGRLYSQPIVLETTPSPGGIAVRGAAADLNGDGRDEVVLVSAAAVDGQSWAYIYIGDLAENGSFRLRRLGYALPVGGVFGFGTNLAVSDVTGDGFPDILLQGKDPEQGEGIWVLRNRGEAEAAFDLTCFIPFGGAVSSFALGDFDLDGKEDLAFALWLEGRMDVFFSAFEPSAGVCVPIERCYLYAGLPGVGAVQAASTLRSPGGGTSLLVAVGGGKARVLQLGAGLPDEVASVDAPADVGGLSTSDVDGDGGDDLVLTDSTQGTVSVQLLKGLEVKGAPLVTTLGTGAAGVAVADLNGDGLSDLIVCLPAEGKVAVVRGLPGGLLGDMVEYPAGVKPMRVAVGDVNGDGLADIVVTNGGTSEVSVLKGLSGGGLASPARVRVVIDPWDLIVADLTGDKLADIAVVSRGPSALSVLVSKGESFRAQLFSLPHGTLPTAIAAVDLDGDGDLDLAVAASGASTVLLFENAGGGNFLVARAAGSRFQQVGPGDLMLVAGDFDANGAKDFLTVNEATGDLGVYFSSGCGHESSFRRGDADSNGSIGIGDAIRILDYLFGGKGDIECQDAADVDDGGTLNIADPVFLLDYLFLGGPPPQNPGPAVCGSDPEPDSLLPCSSLCF